MYVKWHPFYPVFEAIDDNYGLANTPFLNLLSFTKSEFEYRTFAGNRRNEALQLRMRVIWMGYTKLVRKVKVK